VSGLVIAAVAGVLVVQQATRNRRYLQLLESGQQALDAGNSYLAIEAFSGALTLRPDSMVAYYHRGEAYRAQSRAEEAIRDFRAALRLAPGAAQPLIALGDLNNATDPSQAAMWYARAAHLQSDDPSLLYKLGLARYRSGNPAEAIEPLRRAIARNDSLADSHYLLGLAYRDLWRLNEAMAALERAVKLAPTLIAAREELAALYRAAGRSTDEVAQLRALAALDEAPERIVDIALAQARQQQFDAALATLRELAGTASADSRAQLAIGRVQLARAEEGERAAVPPALAALEKALGATARRSEGLALFGRALAIGGEHDRAERILLEAVATSPIDPDAYAYLADACETLGHFGEARDALMALDALQGDTAPAAIRARRALRIGTLSLRANDAAVAADYLMQAISAGEDDAHSLAQLAQARWLLRDRNGARNAIQRGLLEAPGDTELLRLRRQSAE
jgi:tetratricopeptide (TPR) repeat protein